MLREYGKDYLDIRKRWTMGALKLYLDRMRDRDDMEREAMETGKPAERSKGEKWRADFDHAKALGRVVAVGPGAPHAN